MQTSAESTEVVNRTALYKVSRRALIWTWWKRLMISPRTLIALSIWAAMAVACMFLPGNLRFLAMLPMVFLLLAPLNVYQLYAKSVDCEPQLTDQRTVEFSRSRLAFVGPDWRNEMTWKRFKGLSEDAEYFYLDLRHSDLAIIIPKSAFVPEQQQIF